MKMTYLKPTSEDILLSAGDIMITASGDGESIVTDGGNTGAEGILEGDARRYRRDVWEDDEAEEF